jgi:hypothetical protein
MWIVLATPAMGQGVPLTLKIEDADTGRAVPYAEIVHPDVRERHAVDAETGTWTGSVLMLPDGAELFFHRGDALEYDVLAPGYAPLRVSVVVTRRNRAVTVALEPLEWQDPTKGTPAIEERIHGEYVRWLDLSQGVPDSDSVRARNSARIRVASLSEDWLAYLDQTDGDRTLAEQVCRLASSHPERCEP